MLTCIVYQVRCVDGKTELHNRKFTHRHMLMLEFVNGLLSTLRDNQTIEIKVVEVSQQEYAKIANGR